MEAPGRILNRGIWSEAPRVGDAAIRQAQDAAHQAVMSKQRASDKAAALAEAIRKAAEWRELATPQACERPRRFRALRALHVPDDALKLAFSEARGDGATWPRSLEEWRKHATPNASGNDIRRLQRVIEWNSWSNEDTIRDAS